MIKNKLCLTLLGLLSCGTCLGATGPVQRFTFEYCYMSPVHHNSTHKGKLFVKISSNGSVQNKLINFYCYNSKYKTGTMISGIRPKTESGEATKEFGNNLLVENGNRFRLFCSDSDYTENSIWFDQFYHDDYPYLKVDELSSLSYEVNNILGYTKERGHFMTTNKYCFNNWYALNDINIYNKFDIEMFSFEELFGPLHVPVTYYGIDLILPANYGLFADQSDDENMLNHLSINLKLVDQGDNRFVLAFNQDLFVNPYTYQMARSPRSGFVQTKYIYLPKNGFQNFKKLDFSIYGEKLGTMNLNFNYHFSIEAEKQRVGDCVSSEYCVRTNDANFGDNGKELVHD